MYLLVSLLVFALVLVLPALAGIRELLHPRDDGQLHIAMSYRRNPRWFGASFRTMMAPFVASVHGATPLGEHIELRTDEPVMWASTLAIAPNERLRGISVGDRISVGIAAGIRDAYALESLAVGNDVTARTLASDGPLQIGNGVTVLRWADAHGEIDVGSNSTLGLSASSAGMVTIRDNVTFERLWGSPVISSTSALADIVAPRQDAAVTRIHTAGYDPTKPLIFYRDVTIGAGTHLMCDLKIHGVLVIEQGARIDGSVIVRGDVFLLGDVCVSGHVFAEGDIHLGPHTRIGKSGGIKTVYSAKHVYVSDDVQIWGWVVAEDGGRTL